VLEGCDNIIVKGFNLIIEGGSYDSPISGHDASNDRAKNKYAKQFCGWGGFCNDLATSLYKRRAGRLTTISLLIRYLVTAATSTELCLPSPMRLSKSKHFARL
jgi:hypothetical protein